MILLRCRFLQIIGISLIIALTAIPGIAGWQWVGTEYNGTYGNAGCEYVGYCRHTDHSGEWTVGIPSPAVKWTSCCGKGTAYALGTVKMTWKWIGDNPPASAVVGTYTSQGHNNPAGATVEASYLTATSRWNTREGSPGYRDCYFERRYATDANGAITASWSTGCHATAYGPAGTICVSAGYNAKISNDFTVPQADRRVVEVPGSTDPRHYHKTRPDWKPQLGSNGNADGDPVDLATGEDLYMPNPDIVVYNPYGPPAVYLRNFISRQAKAQPQAYNSPGLSDGWVDTYDVKASPDNASQWSNITLLYSNSATEVYIPEIVNDEPTGKFTPQKRTNRYITGDPSSTAGQWDSLTLTFKDGTSWTLTPASANSYILTKITNRLGHYISIVRDPDHDYRIIEIRNDAAQNSVLLQVIYDPVTGYLSRIEDAYGRKIEYTFGLKGQVNATCLATVSRISPSSINNPLVHYAYDYSAVTGRPHLTSITSTSPTGLDTSTETMVYNAEGQVVSLVDANQNVTTFSYDSPDSTLVQVKNAQGTIESEWRACFDPENRNLSLGTTDAKGYSVSCRYEELSDNQNRRIIVDKNNREIACTYDQFDNIISIENARGTVTKYTYDYDVFPLGRLREIEEASNLPADDPMRRPKTTISYYEPSGLVQSITYPAPGSTGPSGATLITSFTYDLEDNPTAGTRGLGNILTSVRPGNNAATNIATIYDYGPYADIKLGQPKTITICDASDPSPTKTKSVVHLEYDERGNLTSSTDALGNRVDFTFNVADQLLSTILPPTSQ